MKRFKKLNLLAFLLTAALLAGCGTESGYIPPTAKEIAEYSAALENKDICEIPEGMTFKDIQSLIYIDGKQIEMPCTLKELAENTEGFTITNLDGNEVDPEGPAISATFKKDGSVIDTFNYEDGRIAYIYTTEGNALKIGGTIGIGDNISGVFEMLGCTDKYDIKSYAYIYDLWFTDGVNAVKLSIIANGDGNIEIIYFDADLTVDSIPDKPIYDNEDLEADPVEAKFEITDWTMEELVSDISVDGLVFSLPCPAEVFTDKYETEAFDFKGIKDRVWGDAIYKDGKKIATLYYDNETEDKTVRILMLDALINDDGYIPEFNIMGITDKSTPEDVVKILGEPNFDNGYDTDYTYYFSEKKELCISFDEETKSRIEFLRIRYLNQ